jgi:enhancing lycopene biosynthesis protein 2
MRQEVAMQKKVAVILAGCGVNDGSEIHEATLTLLHLDLAGAEVHVFAPDKPQMHVINHVKGEEAPGETRGVMVEAARISRGEITPMREGKTEEFDAIVLPGGFGAAKNLCDYAVKGADCTVDPAVERALLEFHEAGKPIGLMCIAPAIGARVFGSREIPVQLTIGHDEGTAKDLETMGAKHVEADVDEIVVDEEHKVVSTPAYMLGPSIKDVNAGIEKLVKKVLELA